MRSSKSIVFKSSCLAASVLLLLVSMLYGMDPISDEELDAVVGQDGVSIFQQGKPSIAVSFTSISWGDQDGISGHRQPGYLILEGLTSSGASMPADILISMKDAIITMDVFTVPIGSSIDFNMDGVADMKALESGVRLGVPYVLWNSNLPNIIRCSMNQSGTYALGDDLIELRLANFVMDLSSSPTALYLWPH